MLKIEFNAAFRTDKAGRAANQDNGFCYPDLSDNATHGSKDLNTDRTMQLGASGALFVVADGMGGMNAGEKASELVVKGIQQAFARLPGGIGGDASLMNQYLTQAIISADNMVKEYARLHPETRGMGSTVVALWICDGTAVAAWVGDSRIYRFNPANGIVRLSHDHSYVQSLVDSGRLPENLAFDHPDSNIITRSLGDNDEPVKPESRIYKIYDGDEFLLCSDGLCGLLKDSETEAVMRAHIGSSKATLDALWQKGSEKGWSDNATVEVVCVTGELLPPRKGEPEGYPVVAQRKPRQVSFGNKRTGSVSRSEEDIPAPVPAQPAPRRNNMLYVYIIAAVIIASAAVTAFYFLNKNNKDEPEYTGNVEFTEDEAAAGKLTDEILELKNKRDYIQKLVDSYKGNIAGMPSDTRNILNKKCRELTDGCGELLDRHNMTEDQINVVNQLLEYGKGIQYLEVNSKIAPQQRQPGTQPQQPARQQTQRQPQQQQANPQSQETPHKDDQPAPGPEKPRPEKTKPVEGPVKPS